MTPEPAQTCHPANGLREKLAKHLTRKGDEEKCFVSKYSLDVCWPDEELLKSKLGLSCWQNESLLPILSKQCRIVACVLAWIRYEPFCEKLEELCQTIHDSPDQNGSVLLSDLKLVIGEDTCTHLFGLETGKSFYEAQFIFYPIIISSSYRGIHEIHPKRRWPYASPAKEIGFGAYGQVSKVVVVKSQLSEAEGYSNGEDTTVAYKSLQRSKDWIKEVKNLDFLKESLTGHKRLVMHIAAFIQNDHAYIFLPHTPLGDLETFLKEGTRQDDGDPPQDHELYSFAEQFPSFDLPDLVKEFSAIIDATAYLHGRISSDQGISIICAHADLRPSNILVFPGGADNPAGIWQISDFGISSVQLDGNRLPEPVTPQYPSIGDIVDERWAPAGSTSVSLKLIGSHVAPERSLRGYYKPKESDVWSLGCIFLEILIFSLGTQQKGNRKSKLEEFRSEKVMWNGPGRDDYFFSFKEPQDSREADVKVEVTRRDRVDKWLEYLHNEKEQFHRELALVVHQMLEPNPELRCSAESAHKAISVAQKKSSDLEIDQDKKELKSEIWKFLATRRIDQNSDGALRYMGDLSRSPTSGGSDDEQTSRLPPRQSSQTVELDDTPLSSTLEVISQRTTTWQDLPTNPPGSGSAEANSAMAVMISSTDEVAVYLCTAKTSSFLHFKPRVKSFTLKFSRQQEEHTTTEVCRPQKLPPGIAWEHMRVSGSLVVVTGSCGKPKKKSVFIYDFAEKSEVESISSDEIQGMNIVVPSATGKFVAYNSQSFVVWQSNQMISKHTITPHLGANGQICFNATGSYMFTWSCCPDNDTIKIWEAAHDQPKIYASFPIPRPRRRGGPEMMCLVPCGSRPACIVRSAHGMWFTATAKANDNDLTAREQSRWGSHEPKNTSLCAADDRFFFYVSENKYIRVCGLLWAGVDKFDLGPVSEPLVTLNLSEPATLALHHEEDHDYRLIVCNLAGGMEVIKLKATQHSV